MFICYIAIYQIYPIVIHIYHSIYFIIICLFFIPAPDLIVCYYSDVVIHFHYIHWIQYFNDIPSDPYFI